MAKSSFPLRSIHLDFHTGPDIPDVGRDFDPDQFAQTFADAHVDMVTVFAKCHHGHLYYDTDRPERHPGLARDLDLMGAQIEALRRRGIAAPIYLSVQCDEYAANTHPEWMVLAPDGRLGRRRGPLEAGWQIMDMSSPYQEYLADQLAEVLKKYGPVDGVFMDMCWDQVSVSKWARDGMRKRGYDPADADDRQEYAREVAHQYMARFKKMVDQATKGGFGVWFNSRPKTGLGYEKRFVGHIEVECLPTGAWGYSYLPYVARFVRPLGMPTLIHTGRFHTAWGDFGGLKPEAALKYECCSALSMGMTRGVGDQLHPRGVPDRAAYELIGRVYGHIEKCEPYVEGGRLLSQIAVIIDPDLGDRAGPVGKGIVRALQENQQQFDFLAASGNLKGYKLAIVPENIRIDKELKKKLQAHLKAGGALMVSGPAALDEKSQPVMKDLGIRVHGESPYTATYLRPARAIAKGLPALDHVMYERGFRMTPAKGAKALCRVVEPYFERTYEHFVSHRQTPPDKPSRYAAIVHNGRAITLSVPIFEAFGAHGSIPYKRIIGNCIDLLLPEPLLRADGPAHLETTVVRKGRTTVVHLLSFYPCRRTDRLDIIEDAFPLVDMPLAVRLPRKPKRALLAPAGTQLPFEYKDGYAQTTITTTDGHVMVVFE